MKPHSTVDLLVLVVGVAAITMLVRPQSRGPELVMGLGMAWVNLFRATVGANIAVEPSSNATPSTPPPGGPTVLV